MNRFLVCFAWLFGFAIAQAVEYKVEPLNEAPPTKDLSSAIAGELSSTGIRVIRGSSATFCDIWLRKEWTNVADFKPTPEIAYPFQPGQLIGVAKFARKASDFRDQDIQPGTYTLRYGQQPVDGSHVGTSPTRDFLLLIQAAHDQKPDTLEYKPLTKQSAEAAGSNHPALLNMQKVTTDATEFPALRHNEDRDWWIVALRGQSKSGNASKPTVIEFVIAGVAGE